MSNTKVRLVASTKLEVSDVEIYEGISTYIARITTDKTDEQKANENVKQLIKHCLLNQHWSVFEHDYLSIEIHTTLDVATQLLRHKSFTFQQFSQRYSSNIDTFVVPDEIRSQGTKNRQGSDVKHENVVFVKNRIAKVYELIKEAYNELIMCGVAKEQARCILPQGTLTRLIMTGNLRSWITYLNIRLEEHTQKEHREVAKLIGEILLNKYRYIAEITNNFNEFKGSFIGDFYTIDLDEFFKDLQLIEIGDKEHHIFRDNREMLRQKYEDKILNSNNNLLIKLWNNLIK